MTITVLDHGIGSTIAALVLVDWKEKVVPGGKLNIFYLWYGRTCIHTSSWFILQLHVLIESTDVSFVSLYIIRSQYFHNVLWIWSAYHCISVFPPDEKLQLSPETEWELIHVYTFHKADVFHFQPSTHYSLSFSFHFCHAQQFAWRWHSWVFPILRS